MKTLELKQKNVDFKEFKQRSALEEDCSQLIDEDCLINVDGKPKILYCKVPFSTAHLRWAVKNIEYSETTRTSGLKTRSAIFGYSPRITMRKDYCSATAMAQKFPKQHYVICDFAKHLIGLYKDHFPETLMKHYREANGKVKPEWLIPETPFTSGIVNKNNPLKYHHDAGNFKNVLSNMIVLKRGVKGGRLACPEFDIKFETADDHLVIFDGAQILHGVTPIIKPINDENCYRYSVVYYSLQQMWNCENIDEEVKRIRKVKKEREHRRIGGHQGSATQE